MLVTMNLTTIKKAIHSVLESKPFWLNSITDDRTLQLIAVSNGMASQVSIDLSNTDIQFLLNNALERFKMR